MQNIPEYFIDSNYEKVKYDGSPILSRTSIYGIYLEEWSVLLVKQKNQKHWDFPGGGIEMGEELEEALLREAKEESGWNLFPTQIVSTHSEWFYHSGQKKFYRALQIFSLTAGKKVSEPLEKNIEVVKFVGLDELDKYPLYPSAMIALENAVQASRSSCSCGGACSC